MRNIAFILLCTVLLTFNAVAMEQNLCEKCNKESSVREFDSSIISLLSAAGNAARGSSVQTFSMTLIVQFIFNFYHVAFFSTKIFGAYIRYIY